jgi:outer membrane PBP1 activator LpoA protein
VRALPFVTTAILFAACSQSPEQQQADQIRGDANKQAAALTHRAEAQAAPLDEQAEVLKNEAKQVGGYNGKRLNVRAGALKQEGQLDRKQGDEQAAAVKESADARIKALHSR